MRNISITQLTKAGLINKETLTTVETDKLAKLVNNSVSVDMSNAGINVFRAFEDSVDTLETKANLTVNVQDYEYFRISDASVSLICSSVWGDHVGISRSQASSVMVTPNGNIPAFSTQFTNNSNIETFDELFNFTELSYIPGSSDGTGAFQNCTKLRSVTLPSKALTINQYAFAGDSSLTVVHNGSNVRNINLAAFKNCTSLTTIDNISPSTISDYAFQNCKSLQRVGLSSIELSSSHVFEGCESLESILDLGGTTKIIGSFFFKDCKNLKNLQNSSTVETINEYAFFNDSSLFSVGTMKPKYVGSHAFANCNSLETFTFDDSSCIIGTSAFENCSALNTINAIKSKAIINNYAFKGDASLPFLKLEYNGLNELTSTNAFADTNIIVYYGLGEFPYHDNTIKNIHLQNNVWSQYDSSLDTWFNHEVSLPSGYVRQNWIQTDGSVYINTGLTMNDSTRFISDMSFIKTFNGNTCVHGNRNSGLLADKTNGVRFNLKNHTEPLVGSSSWMDRTERLYDINIPNDRLTVNETNVHTVSDSSITPGTIYIFGDSQCNYVSKHWLCRVMNDSSVVSNMIPCYEESTLKVGVYDTIRNTFSGSTTYTCNDINKVVCDSDGTTSITTEDGYEILI